MVGCERSKYGRQVAHARLLAFVGQHDREQPEPGRFGDGLEQRGHLRGLLGTHRLVRERDTARQRVGQEG